MAEIASGRHWHASTPGQRQSGAFPRRTAAQSAPLQGCGRTAVYCGPVWQRAAGGRSGGAIRKELQLPPPTHAPGLGQSGLRTGHFKDVALRSRRGEVIEMASHPKLKSNRPFLRRSGNWRWRSRKGDVRQNGRRATPEWGGERFSGSHNCACE